MGTDPQGEQNLIDRISVTFLLDGNFCFSPRKEHVGEHQVANLTLSHRIRCESPDRCINYCGLLQELSEDNTLSLPTSQSKALDSIAPTHTLLPTFLSRELKDTPQLPDPATIGGVCPPNCTWAVNRLSVTTVTRTILVSASQVLATCQTPFIVSSNQESLWLTVAIVTTMLLVGMVIISMVLACILCLRRCEKSMDTKVKIHTATQSDQHQNQGRAKVYT